MLTYNIILHIFGIIDNSEVPLYEESSEFVLREKGYKGSWRSGYFSPAQLSILKNLVGSLDYSISELYWISNKYINNNDNENNISGWYYDGTYLYYQRNIRAIPEKLIFLSPITDDLLLIIGVSGTLWEIDYSETPIFKILTNHSPVTSINDDITFYLDGTAKNYIGEKIINIDLPEKYYIIEDYWFDNDTSTQYYIGISHTNELHELDEDYKFLRKVDDFPVFIDFHFCNGKIFFINEAGQCLYYSFYIKKYWSCELLDYLGPWKSIINKSSRYTDFILKGRKIINIKDDPYHKPKIVLEGEYL